MAISAGIKVPKKKARATPTVRRGAKVTGPNWDGCENWSGAEYHKFQRIAKSFFYDNYKSADLEPDVWAWMKENGYTADEIRYAKSSKGSSAVSVNTAILCKLLRSGMMDLNPKHAAYWDSLPGTSGDLKPASEHIKKVLVKSITDGKEEVAKAKLAEKASANLYIPTIQQRITEQAHTAAEEIDNWLEGFTTDKANFNPKGFDFKNHFRKLNVTQAHARKILSFYEGILEEFRELQSMPTAAQLKKMDERTADMWEQLKEGYSHLNKRDVQNYITALETLVDACMLIVDASKATRKPRTAKPKSADKLIVKLKYLKVDQKNSLASINPVDIVGASELWVFNIKTRKLGKYVASNIDPTGQARAGSGLSVKGATIIGFNEELSVQKTLRKPEVQLKEFKAAGKVALRKFMEEIATTDTKLNGRINADTVLLKVS